MREMKAVNGLFLPVALFILLSVFSISKPLLLIVNVYGSPDIETGSPSSNYSISGRWLTTSFAYSSDDNYAYAGLTAQQGYGDYDFSFTASDEITKVEIGLEAYATSGGVGYYVSWDDGSSWTYCDVITGAEELKWTDVTGSTDWTATKLE